MSPIVVHKNFTKEYLDDPENSHPKLINNLCRAFDRAAYQKDYIIIEGTGHAGVGSVFNLSNAEVAKTLNAKVILVASGGIGRPIDEIALNKALFESVGVEIIGVIINKVESDKMDFIQYYCKKALKNMHLKLLGCIPSYEQLSIPSLSQVIDEIKGEKLNQIHQPQIRKIKKVVIGAKAAKSIIEEIEDGTLIITPSDRKDIIESVLSLNPDNKLSGILLTNGLQIDGTLLDQIKQSPTPFIASNEDSFKVTTRINKMTIKTQPNDSINIPIIKAISKKFLDLAEIENAFRSSL